MNKNLLVFGALALLLVGGLIGYSLVPKLFGTTYIGYQAAQGWLPLWNALNSLVIDVTNVRAPLAGLLTGSQSVSWGSPLNGLASSTVINIAGGAAAGDAFSVYPSASGSIVFGGQITAAATSNASATIYAVNTTTTAAVAGTITMKYTLLPASSFVAPTAIGTATSTTSY